MDQLLQSLADSAPELRPEPEGTSHLPSSCQKRQGLGSGEDETKPGKPAEGPGRGASTCFSVASGQDMVKLAQLDAVVLCAAIE